MPAERVSMKKIRDVLRLTFELKMSRRRVSEATGIGRTAVTDYVQRAAAAGLGWPLPDGLDDTDLERRLFPPAAGSQALASTEPDWAVIHAEMKRRGVTMTLLWQEYRIEHGQGYAYSWFCEQYRDWKKCVSPTMRQDPDDPRPGLPKLWIAPSRSCFSDNASGSFGRTMLATVGLLFTLVVASPAKR